MQTDNESRETVQSVIRAFDILSVFTPDRPTLGVSEISSILKLNRTTVHRLLSTMEGRGVVQRVPGSQKYTIGTQIVRLANVFFHQSDVRTVAMPTLTALRDATLQTAALHVRDGQHRVVIAQVESREDLRVTYPNLGNLIPLHIGAPGKAILANLEPAEIERYLTTVPLDAMMVHTPIDENTLRTELIQIRKQGFSITSQERRLGVLSIATPVHNAAGAAIGSVNVSAPIQRMGEQEIEECTPRVVQAGREISAQLGYHPQS